MKFSRLKLFSLLIGTVVLLQFFQNCGQGFQVADMGVSGMSLGSNHPGFAVVEPTSQSPVLANRVYITALLTENFTDSTLSGADQNNLTNMVNQWVYNKTSAYGYPCDVKVDGGSCDGTVVAPMNSGTNTLRAAFKSQACQSILSQDIYLKAFLNKIGSEPSAPSESAMTKAYEMFYRGDDIDYDLVRGLISTDRLVYSRNPGMSVLDRWRYLVLALCESPGWEQL